MKFDFERSFFDFARILLESRSRRYFFFFLEEIYFDSPIAGLNISSIDTRSRVSIIGAIIRGFIRPSRAILHFKIWLMDHQLQLDYRRFGNWASAGDTSEITRGRFVFAR